MFIIAKTNEEIDRLVDKFENEGLKGPRIYKDNVRYPLSFWRKQMKSTLEAYGAIIFIERFEYNLQEKSGEVCVSWGFPLTAEEWIKLRHDEMAQSDC